MPKKLKWRRIKDGQIVTTRLRQQSDSNFTSVAANRTASKTMYWTTWGSLDRDYRFLGVVE